MQKYLSITFLFVFLINHSIFSQCLPERHSATWYDSWISCSTDTNPNAARGVTHFIKYELDDIYYVYEMKIWNMNAPDYLDYGIQDVYVDLSIDGINWTEFGTFTFGQATGHNDYEGTNEFDFQGERAKYILFTPISNYGGTCYALSEIKVRGRDLCQSNIITWKGGVGDWDIASNWCGGQVPTLTDSVWIPPHGVVTIPISYTADAKWLEVDINAELDINGDINIFGN